MRPMPELTIEEVPTEELVPYARNAKIHTAEQVDQIANSIAEFGFNDPVGVWDSPEGLEIVEGHGRVMAAKKLGLASVPVVRLNHLNDEQRRAYMLAHNQLTMNTGWNFAKLDEELEELDSFDSDSYGFGLKDTFDVIGDLAENGFVDSSRINSETFTVSFVFPADKREVVEVYLRKNGKENIVEHIVEKALEWA